MDAKPPTTPWLRRARWGVAVAALACVGVGLCWVYRAAMVGDVSGAAAAAALCLGVLALDFVAGAVLKMGGLVLRSIQRIEGIENRMTALEVTLGALEESFAQTVDLTDAGTGEVARLVAARIGRDVFPRLVHTEDEGGSSPLQQRSEQDAVGDLGSSISGQSELERLVRQEMERLRAEFADQVRREDYTGALRTGQRIETLFPDSPLADQFQSVREHLLRRTADTPPREPASAI